MRCAICVRALRCSVRARCGCQILLDVPRTCSSSVLFQHQTVQRSLERILYIWALRHPASGYVQVRAARAWLLSRRAAMPLLVLGNWL
jgi:hypothetical protein